MSVPSQPGPPENKPSGNSVVLVVLLAVGFMASLCCAGICGGLAFFYSRSAVAPPIVQRIQRRDVAQPTTLPPDVMEWIVRSQLSRAYTQTLDAVTGNIAVIAALGDAVDNTSDPNELFRRKNTGQLQGDETIEFDVEGQRGAAVVSAVCSPMQIESTPSMPGMSGGYAPKKITVTLKDGTQIDVPPPKIEMPPDGR